MLAENASSEWTGEQNYGNASEKLGRSSTCSVLLSVVGFDGGSFDWRTVMEIASLNKIENTPGYSARGEKCFGCCSEKTRRNTSWKTSHHQVNGLYGFASALWI